ncbi:hypothetical protein SBA4_440019 [Candidatus Sulfopaludibacter sp. SbA4]|nr:hypothetical protein SBA4_440019 [Candidatus Sulfopaludibacter sp. SbA4]
MPVAITSPLTIEEFDRLTLPDDRIWELHDGELVETPLPPWIHREIQARLVERLTLIFPNAEVMMEMPFQFGVRTKRSADVGITSLARSAAAAREGILVGTPEMVIEVISPSNSFSDVMKFKRTCEENDAGVLGGRSLQPDCCGFPREGRRTRYLWNGRAGSHPPVRCDEPPRSTADLRRHRVG